MEGAALVCGLLGAVGVSAALNPERLEAAARMLRHRGPDGQGAVRCSVGTGSVELHHTRLAVIDLSRAADQPLVTSDGRYHLVYNGEIYNYVELRHELRRRGHGFITDSDSEVLLNAWAEWGPGALDRLRGMFAFAVVDSVLEEVYLVRDAFGIKPLYYQAHDGTIHFASEVPALLRAVGGATFRWEAIGRYLGFGEYDVSGETFTREIGTVEAGCYLRIVLRDGGARTERRRWWYPTVAECLPLSFDEAADRLRELFLESVRMHLRSDVKLAFALSGGIDSSAVVCAARHVDPGLEIDTYTFASPHAAQNEEGYAGLVATHVGGRSTITRPAGPDLATDLERLVRAQGEPFGSASIYAQFRVFEAAADAGVTVLLEGQGADELLGGYHGYPAAHLRSLVDKGQWPAALGLLRATRSRPDRSAIRAAAVGLASYLPRRIEAWLLTTGSQLPSGWVSGFPGRPTRARAPGEESHHGRRLTSELRRQLVGSGALGALLRHADRNSMHFSLESRVPFLTVDIAEFLLQLPESFLVSTDGTTKHVFRAAMRGIVPDTILDRQDKIGFTAPDESWLRRLLQTPHVREQIAGSELLNGARVGTDLEAWLNGSRIGSGSLWWRVVNLVVWERQMAELNVVAA